MPRPNVKRTTPVTKRPSDPVGYVGPYERRHRYVTSTLTNEEHAALRIRAEEAGLATTTLATRVVRQFLSEPYDIDAWQDDGENYPKDEAVREEA